MAVYKVLDNGEEINRIVAGEEFAESYAAETGYILEREPDPPEPEPEPEPETPVTWDELAVAIREGVNSL